jgi:hypothetical protein
MPVTGIQPVTRSFSLLPSSARNLKADDRLQPVTSTLEPYRR